MPVKWTVRIWRNIFHKSCQHGYPLLHAMLCWTASRTPFIAVIYSVAWRMDQPCTWTVTKISTTSHSVLNASVLTYHAALVPAWPIRQTSVAACLESCQLQRRQIGISQNHRQKTLADTVYWLGRVAICRIEILVYIDVMPAKCWHSDYCKNMQLFIGWCSRVHSKPTKYWQSLNLKLKVSRCGKFWTKPLVLM